MSLPRPPAVVVGPGRVGTAISNFYKPPAPLISRSQQLPSELTDTPIWVCTTNDGLDSVIQHTAVTPAQQQQLIFVQNGMLLPWLQQNGLQHNTQVLLYMSATEDGRVYGLRTAVWALGTIHRSNIPAHSATAATVAAAAVAAVAAAVPAATADGRVADGLRTAVWGPWAQHVSATLSANGVSCAVVGDWAQFHQLMLVKLLWSSVFWLLSAGLGGKPVGEIAQHHASDVSELVEELLPLGQAHLRTLNSSDSSGSSGNSTPSQQQRQQWPQSLPQQQQQQQHVQELGHDAVLDQLLSYSLAIAAAVPSAEMARREFAWRNGFFLGLPGGRTPKHCEWLSRAGCADLL